jgi:hypothetical protein
LALDPSEIIKYFTRKERYPSLAAWSFKLEQLYREFLTLRILVVESIDIKDNPALSFQEVQKNLYKQLGISIEVAEGAESKSSVKVTFNKENMIIDGLTPTVSNLMKQAVREEKITDPSSLTELAQLHYFNKIYKHRYMGFSPELLIYDAFRHWDWAAGIANLCNSILPIFEKLVKKEVYVFPFLDKDLQECTSACNSFLTFLQTQSQSIRTEDLSLEGPSDENPKGDPYIGQTVKPNTPSNPNGGILTPVGSHILLGDAMIETTAAENNIMRLDLPPDYDQPSWTVAKVYVRPGEKLLENMKVVTISAMNIRAEQGRFFKLFQDVHRQLSKIRDKAIYLKEAIEEESRGGAPTPEGEGTGFHPKGHRFESAESAVSDEEVKEASESLGIPEKDTGQLMKKISRAKKKAARSRE